MAAAISFDTHRLKRWDGEPKIRRERRATDAARGTPNALGLDCILRYMKPRPLALTDCGKVLWLITQSVGNRDLRELGRDATQGTALNGDEAFYDRLMTARKISKSPEEY